jgi:hypothetical protein
VWRSETSLFDQGTNDFDIGPFQIPVTERKDVSDYEAALAGAIETLQKI